MAFSDLLQQTARKPAQFDFGSYWKGAPTFKDSTSGQSTSYDPSSDSWVTSPGGTTPGWQQGWGDLQAKLTQQYGMEGGLTILAQLSKDPNFLQRFSQRYPDTNWNVIGDTLGNRLQQVQSTHGADWQEGAVLAGLAAITGGALAGPLMAAGASPAVAGAAGGAAGGAVTSGVSGGNVGEGALVGGATGGAVGGFTDLLSGTAVPAETGTTPGTASYGGAGDFSTVMPPAITPGPLDAPPMPTPIVPSDPSFGGLLEQTSPGVYSAAPDASGSAGLTNLPLAEAPAPTSGTDLTTSFDKMLTSTGASPTLTVGSTQQLVDPESGPVGGSGVSATAGDPFVAGYDLSDSLGGITDYGAGGTGGTTDSTFGGMLSKVGDFALNNWKTLLPLGLAGVSFLNRPKVPQVPELQNTAGQMTPEQQAAQQSATSLIPTVNTGILPPGADSMVNNATNDAVNSIRSKYAQLNMSGSTSEAQEIAAAQARGEAMRFQFANQLTQTGLQAAGIAAGISSQQAQIYSLIMNAQLQADSALQNALANFAFAAALGGGLKGG